MSYMTINNGEIILHDAFDKPRSLVALGNPAANQSDLQSVALFGEVNDTLRKLFDQTAAGAVNSLIFLRIVNELLRKPQVHTALHVGQWSPLDEALVKTLPKFNDKNFLWCYAPTRPVEQFRHVNFVFAEVDGGGVFHSAK